ncbi:hypothetical protein Vretifemale_14365, partial [Volvox reticuliferus]
MQQRLSCNHGYRARGLVLPCLMLKPSNHPGQKQEAAGPQAVKGVLLALSGWFSRAGWVGPFDPVSRTGNPCECPWVSDYRKEYTRLQMVGGYEEVLAVPMTEEKRIW